MKPNSRFEGLEWTDVEEIKQLYHRFVLLHDQRRDGEALDLYDYSQRDDGGFLYDVSALGITGPAATTRAEFEAWFRRENIAVSAVAHMNLNLIVEAEGPGRAKGSSFMLFRGLLKSGVTIMGTTFSEDTFVLTDQGWRFRTRRFRQIGPPPTAITSAPPSWDKVHENFSAAKADK